MAWHDDDATWATLRRFLFTRARWDAAVVEVEQIAALVGLPAGGRVLDLCCGVGRHSVAFARRGHRVTGVDRTRAYLDEARQAATGLGVELIERDARAFQSPPVFDLAVNLFTSFGYYDDPADDLRVLKNLRAAVKPGGAAVVELAGKEVLARRWSEREWFEAEGLLVLEERQLDPGWTGITTRLVLVDEAGTRRSSFHLRLYAGSELAAALTAAGFERVDLYGDFAGNPYDADARRLVAVAR